MLIAEHPRTDPDEPDSSIRLLPWVSDGKALVGPGVKDARLGEPAGGHFRHAVPREAVLLHSPPQLLLDILQLRPLTVAPSFPLKLEVAPAGSTADVGEAQEREGFRSAEPASRASGRRMASELDQAGLFRMERQRERVEPLTHCI